MRHDATIPAKLTTSADLDEDWRDGDTTLGYVLNRRFTRYLEAALSGFSEQELLMQLEDVDTRAYRAYVLRQRGRGLEDIAAQLGCSRRTVTRLLDIGAQVMGRPAWRDSPAGMPCEQRAAVLAEQRREVYAAYVLAGYGHSQAVIADMLGLSERTVRRYWDEAERWMGVSAREWGRGHRRVFVTVAARS